MSESVGPVCHPLCLAEENSGAELGEDAKLGMDKRCAPSQGATVIEPRRALMGIVAELGGSVWAARQARERACKRGAKALPQRLEGSGGWFCPGGPFHRAR